MKYRFDLYVRYTVELEIQTPLRTLESVQRQANHDFATVLRRFVPGLETYACAAPPNAAESGVALPVRTDADLHNYMQALPAGYPIFEFHIPEESAQVVMQQYFDTMQSYETQVQQLQSQIQDLRTQGHGMQQGFALLHQVAPAPDDQVYGTIQRYGQGIDPVVTTLVANSQDLWTAQIGLRAMVHYASDSQSHMQEVYHTGGLDPVIVAMKGFPNDPFVQQHGCHVLSAAASYPEYCRALRHLGVPEVIISSMKHFPSNQAVQQHGCLALGQMAAASPEARDEIVHAGGVQALIHAIKVFPEDPWVNRYALSAVQPLAYDPQYAQEILSAGGVQVVLSALKHHAGDPQVAFNGLTMLAELARHDECKHQLAEAGIVPIILNSMATYAGDPIVQESGLRCLAFLCDNNPQNQQILFNANGIPIVVNATSTATKTSTADNPATGVVSEGLNLLGNLATHPECRPSIVHHQGVETTLTAMRTFSDVMPVQEHGLRIVAGVASSSEAVRHLVSQGALPACVSSMWACQGSPMVCMSGAYAVGMLSGPESCKAAVQAAGGIEVLLACLQRHPADPLVQEQGCAALAVLGHLDANKPLIVHTQVNQIPGGQTLCTSVQNMAGHPRACKQGVKVISVVATHEEVKHFLVQAGALPCLATAIHACNSDPDVVHYAAESLALLLSPQLGPEHLQTCADLLRMVVQAMSTHQADAHIQESGCEVLALLAAFEPLQEAFIGAGGVRALTAAMGNFQGNTGIQRKGCRAFANLADYPQSRLAVLQEGGIKQIIEGIRYHVQHPEVGEQGCAAIANLALDAQCRAAIGMQDGVKACIAGMQSHSEHAGIQAYGLGALGNLAVEEQNCQVILQQGATQMVIHAMTTWPADPRVQHFACLAISNFAHDDANKIAIGQMGGNRLVVSAMHQHTDHAGVQEQACGALANLGIHQQNMVEIANLNGIEHVVAALRKFVTSMRVQENACFALSKFLTDHNENYRHRMLSAGVMEALQAVKDTNPSFDVKICVNVLLRRLDGAEAPGSNGTHGAPLPGALIAGPVPGPDGLHVQQQHIQQPPMQPPMHPPMQQHVQQPPMQQPPQQHAPPPRPAPPTPRQQHPPKAPPPRSSRGKPGAGTPQPTRPPPSTGGTPQHPRPPNLATAAGAAHVTARMQVKVPSRSPPNAYPGSHGPAGPPKGAAPKPPAKKRGMFG